MIQTAFWGLIKQTEHNYLSQRLIPLEPNIHFRRASVGIREVYINVLKMNVCVITLFRPEN